MANLHTSKNYSLNLGGKLYAINCPYIMGILNITPDSFYDGGQYTLEEHWVKRTAQMLHEGADIIDVGAASTRPGAQHIDAKEEINRLSPVLKSIRKNFPEAIISVDTYQSEVAKASIDLGAHMINDISGGTLDNNMFKTIGQLKVPYVLMHIAGKPSNMQDNPQYTNVFKTVSSFFSQQIEKLLAYGVNDIILDPGFGFGKNLEHNYQILNKLHDFTIFDKPILVGMSRKRMVYELLQNNATEALNGTTVVHTLALKNGASFIRTHDVKEAVEAVKIVTFTQNLS